MVIMMIDVFRPSVYQGCIFLANNNLRLKISNSQYNSFNNLKRFTTKFIVRYSANLTIAIDW